MAFCKKNNVKINPLAYSHCILGEPKCGKTTIVYQILEKLAGSDGYIFAELGKERGADAIQGISYVNCPTWISKYDELTNSVGFETLVNDICLNKDTEYPDLKVMVIDTYDQLINIAEQRAIDIWNRENPEKMSTSIKATWGGFDGPTKKVMSLIFDLESKLESVGVKLFWIGHVKNKEITDTVSGETYTTLTSDQSNSYFKALQKNIHFLSLAFIDRTLARQKIGNENPVTHRTKEVNKVISEVRRIQFRDDTLAVDSGCRFADITPEIEFSAEAYIEAVTDAIKAERNKSSVSFEDTVKKQQEEEKELEERATAAAIANREAEELNMLLEDITDFCKEYKTDKEKIKCISLALASVGAKTLTDITTLDDARKIMKAIESC